MKRFTLFAVMASFMTMLAACIEEPGTDKPDEGGEDVPEIKDSNLIGEISIRFNGTDSHTYTINYDEDDRPVRIDLLGFESDEMVSYRYDIEYAGNQVKIHGDDNIEIELELDGLGRAVTGTYREEYRDGDYTETHETELTFTYDSQGRLIREDGKEDGYDDYAIKYTWEDGNMVNSHIEYYDEPFMYSEYPNEANIDINWIITAGYGSYIGALGFLDIFGQRSACYAYPDYLENDVATGNGREEFVCEDRIGITLTREYDVYHVAYDETTAEYEFNGENNLLGIVKTVPAYLISYTQDYTINILYPDGYFIGEDGKKYYYSDALEYDYQPAVETGREALEPNVTYVDIIY